MVGVALLCLAEAGRSLRVLLAPVVDVVGGATGLAGPLPLRLVDAACCVAAVLVAAV